MSYIMELLFMTVMVLTVALVLLLALKAVQFADELMLITANGQIMRTGLDQIRPIGRNTQGVRLIKLREGDKLVAAAKIAPEEEKEQSGDSTAPPQEPPQQQDEAEESEPETEPEEEEVEPEEKPKSKQQNKSGVAKAKSESKPKDKGKIKRK
jgi:DNA gyrase/topoisomerase IV subunit A